MKRQNRQAPGKPFQSGLMFVGKAKSLPKSNTLAY